MTTTESNKLIAEFMGAKIHKAPHAIQYEFPFKIGVDIHGDEGFEYLDGDTLWEILQFHTSWDWLMLVVEKIRKNSERMVLIQNANSTILKFNDGSSFNSFEVHVREVGINAVWKAVVEFIQWSIRCGKQYK